MQSGGYKEIHANVPGMLTAAYLNMKLCLSGEDCSTCDFNKRVSARCPVYCTVPSVTMEERNTSIVNYLTWSGVGL